MTSSREDLVNYRLERAKDTLDDARILADNKKWNSTINRLYYAAYYAVIALLLNSNLKPTTHKGAKTEFSNHFIKSQIIPKEFGKIYSQLFTWRQKGDYDDQFDFDSEKVLPYFDPIEKLINLIEQEIARR